MSRRTCRKCKRPTGDALAVCPDCSRRLEHYDEQQRRQDAARLISMGFLARRPGVRRTR